MSASVIQSQSARDEPIAADGWVSAMVGALDIDDLRSKRVVFDEDAALAAVVSKMPEDVTIPLAFYKDAITGTDIVAWRELLMIDGNEVPAALGSALTRELLDGEGSGHSVLAAVRGLMESAWRHREYARLGFYRREQERAA